MITFKQSGTIDAPIEKVFSIVSDPNQIPLWRTDVPKISNVSSEPKVGMTFSEEVNFMGKKQLLMKITEYVPNSKLTIVGQSGMGLLPTQSFTFSSQENKTTINLSVEMKVSGFFKIIQFMLSNKLKKVWAGYFINLNDLAGRK